MSVRPAKAALRWRATGVLVACLTAPVWPAAATAATETGSHLGELLPLWSALPFAGILLSIALFPLLAPRF